MSENNLHILSFDVPFPADYGGVIDVFYKIKALYAQGIKIHLHCFKYGREESGNLEKYCEQVYYYERNLSKNLLLHSLPYVVITRQSEALINNLLQNNFPILFEGLHCCYYLGDERLKKRGKIVRMHNIEHDYYEGLARSERKIFKRIYFKKEAKKLRSFESILHKADHILAISASDGHELSKRYKNVIEIPAFHPNEHVEINQGPGNFVLYHGNLEIGENNDAALYLVNFVFNNIDIPFIIAGKKPSQELREAIKGKKNIEIKSNLSSDGILYLIKSAQINILPTFQATGIKLKLLMALFNGRHCIVNTTMVANTGLEKLCSVQNTPEEMKKEVLNYFEKPFNMGEIMQREAILLKAFSNKENIKKLIQICFEYDVKHKPDRS